MGKSLANWLPLECNMAQSKPCREVMSDLCLVVVLYLCLLGSASVQGREFVCHGGVVLNVHMVVGWYLPPTLSAPTLL